MAIYELRTYTLYVGKMAEAVKLYQEIGFPAMQKGEHDKKLVGYFQSDVGTINQIVHLWKFDDDADRRKSWQLLFANPDFMNFAVKFRPLVMTQEVEAPACCAVGTASVGTSGRPQRRHHHKFLPSITVTSMASRSKSSNSRALTPTLGLSKSGLPVDQSGDSE